VASSTRQLAELPPLVSLEHFWSGHWLRHCSHV